MSPTITTAAPSNCADAAANRPDGLQLIKVSSLDEARRALDLERSGGTPTGCS
jgi:PDZ domain-containing protein